MCPSGSRLEQRIAIRLGAAFLICALSSTAAVAVVGLTVTPSEPTCGQSILFEVSGYFPDGCWEVTDIDFSISNNALGFIVYAVDHWQPGYACTEAIIPYASSELVEPLPSGSYWAFAYESVQSLRVPEGDSVGFLLPACCPGTEAPVTDLRLEKIENGRLRFIWSDVPGASQYHLYGDDVPDGDFEIELGSTLNLFLEFSPSQLPEFFLLSHSSVCGESSKH